jgi:superfamily II DNA or RNA helicase
MISIHRQQFSRTIEDMLTRKVTNFDKSTKTLRFWMDGSVNSVKIPKFCFERGILRHIIGLSKPLSSVPISCFSGKIIGTLRSTSKSPQQKIHDEVMSKFTKKDGCSIILPCGTGKTNVALSIAVSMKTKTGILVHKGFLGDQWAQRIEGFVSGSPKIGRIQRDRCEDGDFVIISIQSLLSRDYPAQRLRFGLLIIDEMHHIAAEAFSKVFGKLDVCKSLGLTATPVRKDGLEEVIYWLVGYPIQTKAVVDHSSAQVTQLRWMDSTQTQVNFKRPGSFSKMMTLISKSNARNQMLLHIIESLCKKRPDSKGLVLSDRVDHLKVLYNMLGPDVSEIITGSIKTDATKEDKEIVFRKQVILSTYHLASEGMDFKGDFLVLATPRSNIEQSAGRILRGHSLQVPIIIDIIDDAIKPYYAMSKKREKYYNMCKFQMCCVKINN